MMTRVRGISLFGCLIAVSGCVEMEMETTPTTMSFRAILNGANEVPPVESDASGEATFTLSDEGSSLTFTLTVMNGESITQAHIHLGSPGENGNIVAFLFGFVEPGVAANGELASGTLTADALIGDLQGMPLATLVDELRAGGAYVNVHSEANPPGEIRGQIGPDSAG